MQRIKDRPDADLWQVTRANRDDLPFQVVAWLKERRSQARGPQRGSRVGVEEGCIGGRMPPYL